MSNPIPMGRRRGRSSTGHEGSPVSKPASLSGSQDTKRGLSGSYKRRTSVSSSLRGFTPRTGDDEYDVAPDGEVPAPSKSKGKRGASKDLYQCEICQKWYRHSACLIKHRWQHTDYWQQASALQMSKHQTVMLLETAAILTSGSSLPEEKSLWPAAVSPPSSGLLGSEYLNSETITRFNPQYGSFSSSYKSSLPTIPSKLNSQSGSTDSENATDQDMDEDEPRSAEVDMFVMEELDDATGQMELEDDDPAPLPAKPLASNYKARSSASQFSQSAPALGFFSSRPAGRGAVITGMTTNSVLPPSIASGFDTEMAS